MTAKPTRKKREAKTLLEAEYAGTLPVFDSMQQCETQACVPLAIQRRAKKNGCEAFRSNRVYLKPLLKWLFSQTGDETRNYRHHYEKFHALREEIRYQQDHHEVLARGEVEFTTRKAMALLSSGMDRYAEVEGPSLLVGQNESGIRKLLLDSKEQLMRQFEEGLAGQLNGERKT